MSCRFVAVGKIRMAQQIGEYSVDYLHDLGAATVALFQGLASDSVNRLFDISKISATAAASRRWPACYRQHKKNEFSLPVGVSGFVLYFRGVEREDAECPIVPTKCPGIRPTKDVERCYRVGIQAEPILIDCGGSEDCSPTTCQEMRNVCKR